MKLIESYLKKNPCYKEGRKITVKGLMLHSVGVPQPSAEAFTKSWNKETFDSACVHAFIDANTGTIYQTLPWNYRGWHAGGSANNTHIGVEMCEPSCIRYTGGATFVCSDKARARVAVKKTYDAAVELFAELCEKYNLNPLKDICSHKEGCKLGIASNHGDPEHLWKQLGMTYTMDTFRQAVKNKMTASESKKEEKETDVVYRVQVGAYAKKKNAEAQLKKVKAKDFDAVLVKVNNLYKIQVGAYSKKTNAQNVVVKLEKVGFNAIITTKTGKTVSASTPKKTVTEIAKEVIQGKWGNGESRRSALRKAGYDPDTVQKEVNRML